MSGLVFQMLHQCVRPQAGLGSHGHCPHPYWSLRSCQSGSPAPGRIVMASSLALRTQSHMLPDTGGSCLSRSHHGAGQLWLFKSLSSPGLKPAAQGHSGGSVLRKSHLHSATALRRPMTENAVWGQESKGGRVLIPPEQDRQGAQVLGG